MKTTTTATAAAEGTDHLHTTMQTILDPDTGRNVFVCNQQIIYSWDQNLEEVNLYIPAPPNQTASSLDISIQPQRLQVGIRGHDRFFIDEETYSKVVTHESSWYLDQDSKEIHIVLIKAHRGQVWDRVLKGISNETSQIDPFLQQKMRRDLLLERFQEEHPGFDFRNAEINGDVPDPRNFMGGVKYHT